MNTKELVEYIIHLAIDCAADLELIKQSIALKGIEPQIAEQAYQAARIVLLGGVA